MLAAILSAVGGKFIDGFFTSALQAFTAYQNKQITEAQLKEQLLAAMVQAARDVEVSANEAITKTYAAFMGTLEKSRTLQIAWCVTLYSQVFVLFWSQFAVPLLYAYDLLPNWRAGTTAEWAYLLLAFMIGGGPIILQRGPGASSVLERLKAAIK
jgi:hypothetical protein